MSKNLEQGKRWLAQAQRDLADAKVLLKAESDASQDKVKWSTVNIPTEGRGDKITLART